MSKRIGLAEVPAKWQAREPFETHNKTLYGVAGLHAGGSYYGGTGRLPSEYVKELRSALDNQDVIYIVYSYATPIAWVLKDGTEVKPPVKYSVTTSKHQGKLYGPAIGTRSICRDCDLEIEYVPGRWGSWHDRGGNNSCPKNGYYHLPND
jgi:hypothetical protein